MIVAYPGHIHLGFCDTVIVCLFDEPVNNFSVMLRVCWVEPVLSRA